MAKNCIYKGCVRRRSKLSFCRAHSQCLYPKCKNLISSSYGWCCKEHSKDYTLMLLLYDFKCQVPFGTKKLCKGCGEGKTLNCFYKKKRANTVSIHIPKTCISCMRKKRTKTKKKNNSLK